LWSTLCTNSRRSAHPPWPTTHANALGSWCFGPSLAGAATTVAQQNRNVGRKKEDPIAPHAEFSFSDWFSGFLRYGTIPLFNLVAPHMKPTSVNPASVPCHYAPVGPGADSGQRKKKRSLGAKFGPESCCSARPWGRRAMIPTNERCLLVDCTGHSASVLHDSAVYARK
jgi:hypothetical protein